MKRSNLFGLILSLSTTVSILAIDIDRSSPKATAQSFIKALEAGDIQAARQMVAGTEPEKLVVDAWVDFSASVKKLRESAVKKYGDNADEAVGAGATLDSAKALENTQVTETGDIATVVSTKPQPGQTPMQLRKVDGMWMIDLTETFKGATTAGQSIEQMPAMLKGWAEACRETAGEIDQGQYVTPADANQALTVKMMAALKSATPSTAPATAPSETNPSAK